MFHWPSQPIKIVTATNRQSLVYYVKMLTSPTSSAPHSQGTMHTSHHASRLRSLPHHHRRPGSHCLEMPPDDSCLFHNRRKSRGNPQWRPAFEIKTTKQRSTEERHALRRNPPTSDEGTRKGRWTDCVLFFDDHPESTRRSLDGFTKCPPHELRFAVVSKQQNVLAACRTTATVE